MYFIGFLVLSVVAVLVGWKEALRQKCLRISRRAKKLGVEVLLDTNRQQGSCS